MRKALVYGKLEIDLKHSRIIQKTMCQYHVHAYTSMNMTKLQ